MKSSHPRTYAVSDNGDLRKYRTEIPNIIDDMDLSVYEFRLYVHLKRVAGTDGTCWQGTRKLAESCKMSVGMVAKAKVSLEKRGLIEIRHADKKKDNETDHITIVDIWHDNFDAFAPVQDMNTPVHPENTPVHVVNTPVHPENTPVHDMNERSNSFKNEPIKNEPIDVVAVPPPPKSPKKKPKSSESEEPKRDPEEWREFVGALCWVCYGHKKIDILAEKERVQVLSEAKKIWDFGYRIDDLRRWFGRIWKKDWRWQKSEGRPTPSEVRSKIAAVRAETPDGFDEEPLIPVNGNGAHRNGAYLSGPERNAEIFDNFRAKYGHIELGSDPTTEIRR